MNTPNTFFLLSLLLFLSAGTLAAQRSGDFTAPSVYATAAVAQYVPAAGDHVDGEAVMSFEEAQSSKEQQAIERKLYESHNVTVKEWSPSGKYALLDVSKSLREPCYYDGNGNPYGVGRGQGDAATLNYTAGTNSWDDDLDCSNVVLQDGNLFTYDPASYTPTGFCDNIDRLTPAWSPLPINNVRVAIIDSGIKGIGSFGKVNDVNVSQKVIPADCSQQSCGYYLPSAEESKGFNAHGRFVTTLITGWFRANGLHNRLRVNSYKVLDNELKCSMFQVVKAIEQATSDGNHIISLSLGFIPRGCTPRTIEPGPYGPGSLDPYVTDGSDVLAKSTRRSPLYYAIEDAQNAGVIVITSAGNSGVNLDVSPQYPAAESGLRNLVTVGALTCGEDAIASFSNWSENYVDLFTSGDQVQAIDGVCFRQVDGTSFACPIVTAKAAFHVTMLGGSNPSGVLCQLRGESRPFPGAKYGIVDTQVSHQSCNKSSGSGNTPVTPVVEELAEVRISPNPFNDRITINIPASDALLTIIDARGARVLQKETREAQTTLDLRNLKPGVYWVSVHSAAGTQTKSIVKQ